MRMVCQIDKDKECGVRFTWVELGLPITLKSTAT